MSLNKIPVAVIVSIVLVTAPLAGVARAAETGSSHNLFLLDRIDDKHFFVGRANLVTRDGFSDTFFGYVDANIRYTLDQHWSVEAGYRQAYLKIGDDWREEYRPMLALYWRGKLGEGDFSNRNRIELRYFEGDARNRRRYRNESVWIAPRSYGRHRLTPFVEEEFFYDITDGELNENWLTLGISKFWDKGKKWKLGYRLQSRKTGGEWSNRHLLVTGFSFLSFN
jgi:hypothetical protein